MPHAVADLGRLRDGTARLSRARRRAPAPTERRPRNLCANGRLCRTPTTNSGRLQARERAAGRGDTARRRPTGRPAAERLEHRPRPSGAVGVAVDSEHHDQLQRAGERRRGPWYSISCTTSGAHTRHRERWADRASRSIPTRTSSSTRPARSRSSRRTSPTQDANDPPDTMAANFTSGRSRRRRRRCRDPRDPGRRRTLAEGGPGRVQRHGHRHREALERLLHAGPEPGRRRRRRRKASSSSPRRRRLVARRRRRAASTAQVAGVPAGRRVDDEPDDDRDRVADDRRVVSTRAIRCRRRRSSARRPRPPGEVIEDDATGDVETSGVFDPGNRRDRLLREPRGHARPGEQRRSPSARRTSFGEIWVLADNGAAPACVRRAAGSSPGERLQPRADPARRRHPRRSTPAVNVGDHFSGAGRRRRSTTTSATSSCDLDRAARPRSRAVSRGRSTAAAGADQRSRSRRSTSRTSTRATGRRSSTRSPALIVNNLRSPGRHRARGGAGQQRRRRTTASTDANVTLDTLAAAIQAAGGPATSAGRSIPSTIRTAASPAATSASASSSAPTAGSRSSTGRAATRRLRRRRRRAERTAARLRARAGSTRRTPPGTSSRKPLAAEFTFNGQQVLRDRQPLQLEGRRRAAVRPLPAADALVARCSGTSRRHGQRLRRRRSSRPTRTRTSSCSATSTTSSSRRRAARCSRPAASSHDLIKTLPPNERYSYVFDGNSQSLDHILGEQPVFGTPVRIRRRARQRRVRRPGLRPRSAGRAPGDARAAEAERGGPYSVDEGWTRARVGDWSDPDVTRVVRMGSRRRRRVRDAAVDRDVRAPAPRRAVGSKTITVQATDSERLTSDTDTATVQIDERRAVATFNAPASSRWFTFDDQHDRSERSVCGGTTAASGTRSTAGTATAPLVVATRAVHRRCPARRPSGQIATRTSASRVHRLR